MFRSLHMKLVLIMVLLIISLMTVVGAFLMNAVVRYYLDDFNTRMSTMFSSSRPSGSQLWPPQPVRTGTASARLSRTG